MTDNNDPLAWLLDTGSNMLTGARIAIVAIITIVIVGMIWPQ